MKNTAILLITCPDQKGLVATIADFVFRHNGNILHADEHGDDTSNLFLMRVEFDPAQFDFDLAEFGKRFSPIAEKFSMTWRLAQSNYRPRMAILVSKYDHCLVDLLYRQKSGELACEIPMIISIIRTPGARRLLSPSVLRGAGFGGKQAGGGAIRAGVCYGSKLDLIVLARYMQVLRPIFRRSIRSASSTSTIPSCRRLSAPNRTTRRWSGV